MATSSGFWASGLGRWLASWKNLAGLGLATLALVAHLVLGLGAFWPLVVAAAYGVGALLAPRERIDLSLGLGAEATAGQLRDQLAVLRRSLAGPMRRFDDGVRASLAAVLQNLDDILARWDDLAGAPDQRHTVAQMIIDYLPTSVQTYLNLPRAITAGARAGNDAVRAEFADQLGILQAESGRILAAVTARSVDALTDQGRFLREKFHRSELDLGPE